MFLKRIKALHGTEAFQKTKIWLNINCNLRDIILQKRFLIECRKNDVVPRKVFGIGSKFKDFTFYSNSCDRKFKYILGNFKHSILNLIISDICNHINFLKSKI